MVDAAPRVGQDDSSAAILLALDSYSSKNRAPVELRFLSPLATKEQ